MNIVYYGLKYNTSYFRDTTLATILKAQIEKLQAVVIGMPPYRPNRELSNGEPAIKVNDTVNV